MLLLLKHHRALSTLVFVPLPRLVVAGLNPAHACPFRSPHSIDATPLPDDSPIALVRLLNNLQDRFPPLATLVSARRIRPSARVSLSYR